MSEISDLIEENPDAARLAARLIGDLGLEPGALMAPRAEFVAGIIMAVEHGRRIGMAAVAGMRACRVCGCTEYRACEGSCWWVEADLCSTCADVPQPRAEELA